MNVRRASYRWADDVHDGATWRFSRDVKTFNARGVAVSRVRAGAYDPLGCTPVGVCG